ncbi:MAG: serine acetyltransferase, partial [Methylocella sp.]
MDYRLRENDKDALAQSQWDLHRIVLQLRTLRGEWRQNTKPDGVTYELPSQEALSDVLEGLSAVLFPRHFGPPSLTEEGVDYYIGRTLDGALQSLLEQVRRELKLASGLPDNGGAPREERAIKITRDFAANLPRVRALLESDILAAFQGDPAAQSIDEVLFCYPGIVAIIRHRLAHELYELG